MLTLVALLTAGYTLGISGDFEKLYSSLSKVNSTPARKELADAVKRLEANEKEWAAKLNAERERSNGLARDLAAARAELADRVNAETASGADAQARSNLIPPSWSQMPDDGRSPGRKFVSPDGTAWLAVYAAALADSSSRNHMNAIAYRNGETITYHRRARNWIAVSGLKGNRIFYRKSNLACRGSRWHTIEMEYPAADKQKMDSLVTHIAHGINQYRDDCAPRPPQAR